MEVKKLKTAKHERHDLNKKLFLQTIYIKNANKQHISALARNKSEKFSERCLLQHRLMDLFLGLGATQHLV